MNFVKVVTCLMLVVASKTVSATSVELPTLIMQLRSTVDTSNSQLLSDMLKLTTQYLDSYFGAYYSNVQPVDYFTHTALSVNSFGIHGVEGSYITTLEFDGLDERFWSSTCLKDYNNNIYKTIKLPSADVSSRWLEPPPAKDARLSPHPPPWTHSFLTLR